MRRVRTRQPPWSTTPAAPHPIVVVVLRRLSSFNVFVSYCVFIRVSVDYLYTLDMCLLIIVVKFVYKTLDMCLFISDSRDGD